MRRVTVRLDRRADFAVLSRRYRRVAKAGENRIAGSEQAAFIKWGSRRDESDAAQGSVTFTRLSRRMRVLLKLTQLLLLFRRELVLDPD